jgi:hypothetical protein
MRSRLFRSFLSLAGLSLFAAAAHADTGILARPATSASAKGRIRPMVRALSSESFAGFVRCPAELGDQCTNPFGSIAMENNTAYYRDVIVGAITSISGATDGENWSAVFTDPKGNRNDFAPGFTFHSDFNGSHDCFVSAFQVICGTTSIDILWYLQSQCQATGTWKAEFSNSAIGVQTFELKPSIEPSRVPLQLQSDYPGFPDKKKASGPNPYDQICLRATPPENRDVIHCAIADPVPTGLQRWSIAAKGCFMTDLAIILSYHGYAANPSSLNGLLTGLGANGFDNQGNVNSQGAIHHLQGQGVKIYGPIASTGTLRNDVCRYGPQLVRVTFRDQHWVTAYGVQDDGKILVRDPMNQVSTLTGIRDERVYSGPAFNFKDQITGLKFTFHSPVEIFVTDPMGRRAGFDPATQTTFNEIPNAFYNQSLGEEDATTDEDDPNPGKALEVFGDVDGDYALTVTGTATGSYEAEIQAFDINDNTPRFTIPTTPTSPGQVQTYLVHFERNDATRAELAGGFDGGGQRPRDVNKFLTYGNPSSATTTLPAGTTTFPMAIFYATNILPSTFSVVMNGVDVTAQFHPAPGTNEIVALTLPPGKSVLKLSVDGQLPTRVATDTDRLVLQAQ